MVNYLILSCLHFAIVLISSLLWKELVSASGQIYAIEFIISIDLCIIRQKEISIDYDTLYFSCKKAKDYT